MSSAKKCALLCAALIPACDIGVTLKDPFDMAQSGGDPKPGIDMAETVVDVQFTSCTPMVGDGVGINSVVISSGPKVNYDIKTECINANMGSGASGVAVTNYDCSIDVGKLGERYYDSNHFVLTYDDKSVTPQMSMKAGGVTQGVQSSVSITGMMGANPPLTVSSAGTNDSNFVSRQVSWSGRSDVASLRFTVFLSCVKTLGISPLKDANVPNLSWDVRNFKLHMSQ